MQRFDGFVAKYLGDGVLIYFGYPEAHEDDAERAARAGLELIAAVSALKTPVSLQTRCKVRCLADDATFVRCARSSHQIAHNHEPSGDANTGLQRSRCRSASSSWASG